MISVDTRTAVRCLISLATDIKSSPKTLAELSTSIGMKKSLVAHVVESLARYKIIITCQGQGRRPGYSFPKSKLNEITLQEISKLLDGDTELLLRPCYKNDSTLRPGNSSGHSTPCIHDLQRKRRQILEGIRLSHIVNWLPSNELGLSCKSSSSQYSSV